MSRSKSDALAHFKTRIAKSLDIAKTYSTDAYARKRWLDHADALHLEAEREVLVGTSILKHVIELKQLREVIDAARKG